MMTTRKDSLGANLLAKSELEFEEVVDFVTIKSGRTLGDESLEYRKCLSELQIQVHSLRVN